MADKRERQMSKILEAMRKTGGAADFGFRLETLGVERLFPAPVGRQVAEFERLANELLSLHTGERGLVLTFASNARGEGASYVSFNVARHLSVLLDRKIAWIDANFLSPQRSIEAEGCNFRMLLENPGRLDELDTAGNLAVIPNVDSKFKATHLIAGPGYPELLRACREKFFFTILDAPPILESVDLVHLARPTDGLVVVVEARRLKHEIIRHGIETVSTQGIKVIGSVVNRRTFDIPGFLYRKL